jgi:glycosyltransferase involved in cell wall biosynthesis
MISIVIPAHNEAQVIRRLLAALTKDAWPGELEIVVVCNGCQDETAALARAFGEPVRVLETGIPSKANALNLGDTVATGFPRIYCDADVVLSLDSARRLARVLEDGQVLAAAPAVKTVFPPDVSWAVRSFYRLWMALPYVAEGMMAAGVYAVSREGRRRFGKFPDIIADDGYFRLQFTAGERIEVPDAVSVVTAPRILRDLVFIKTRSRLGFYQARQRFPALFGREARSKSYHRVMWRMLTRRDLWACAVPYLWVNLVSRFRARRQLRATGVWVWERDNSSRTSGEAGAVQPPPANGHA